MAHGPHRSVRQVSLVMKCTSSSEELCQVMLMWTALYADGNCAAAAVCGLAD